MFATKKPNNKTFDKETFIMLQPKFSQIAESNNGKLYEHYYKIAYDRINQWVFLEDWEDAMALCIAHYLFLYNKDNQMGYDLGSIANEQVDGFKHTGRMKTDYSYTTNNNKEAHFWNLSRYGQRLYSLLQTKTFFTIGVATPDGTVV